jgi:hypothetical protein
MAQKVEVSFVDDIDGSEAEGTVSFALDGTGFEIDLSQRNAARLRDLLAPYVGAARRAGAGARPAGRASTRAATDRAETKAVRAWAESQGLKISARGRISSEVQEAYRNRDAAPAAAEPEVAPPGKSRGRPTALAPAFSGAE